MEGDYSVVPIREHCAVPSLVRLSKLAALFTVEIKPSYSAHDCHDAYFPMDAIVATSRGEWQLCDETGWQNLDSSTFVLASRGCRHVCRHDVRFGNSLIAVGLLPGAVDDGIELFEKSVVPAQAMLRLVRGALGALNEDEFDSTVFTLFTEASAASAASSASQVLSLRIQRAKRFIELHAFEQLRLTDIAKELGLSPFTTVRQFRAHTGKTPHAYLLDIRLERAKELLKTTCASVESIGKTVGFDDLAYFSRFFKQRTGVSPSSYRAA